MSLLFLFLGSLIEDQSVRRQRVMCGGLLVLGILIIGCLTFMDGRI